MAKQLRPLFATLGGTAVLLLSGCSVETGPSGATCPPGGTTLTAENFGTSFFNTYCTECHSVQKSGIFQREGAPKEFNFDTVEDVRSHKKEIDEWAASGSTRENTAMPIGDKQPSSEERKKLGEWLACGAP